MHLDRLDKKDAESLFHFEVDHRHYFEQMVPGRGDEYYYWSTFLQKLESLLEEQIAGEGAYYLIRDESKKIVGRLNLTIKDGYADLGYRVGEPFTGKGVAKQALSLAITEARTIPSIKKLVAKTNNS